MDSWATPGYENKIMDRYFSMVLKDLREEKDKIEYIKGLFGELFCSMECLKNRLKKDGLEKIVDSIEMQKPNESGVGMITYHAKNGNSGNFGGYILERWK